MNHRAFLTLVVPLMLACTGLALAATAERVIDLTAADGTQLKTTFFAAAKPGPGVLLLHQCNKDRKIWNGLARENAKRALEMLDLDKSLNEQRKAGIRQSAEQKLKQLGDVPQETISSPASLQ